jgi:hypothetical protein
MFRLFAKKKVALSQVNSAQKQQTPLAQKMKENTLNYARKAVQNAVKLEDRFRKKTLMWHKNMNNIGEV